jgi:hypothetical protein
MPRGPGPRHSHLAWPFGWKWSRCDHSPAFSGRRRSAVSLCRIPTCRWTRHDSSQRDEFHHPRNVRRVPPRAFSVQFSQALIVKSRRFANGNSRADSAAR